MRCCVVRVRVCWRVAVAVSGGRPGVRSICFGVGGDVGVLGSGRVVVVVGRWVDSTGRSVVVALEKNVLIVSCDFPFFSILLRAVLTRRSHLLRTDGLLRRSFSRLLET
jgi:hypothetical protein